jgi:RsiW-degrading membrane proteinase PrsW (M82 family)
MVNAADANSNSIAGDAGFTRFEMETYLARTRAVLREKTTLYILEQRPAQSLLEHISASLLHKFFGARARRTNAHAPTVRVYWSG